MSNFPGVFRLLDNKSPHTGAIIVHNLKIQVWILLGVLGLAIFFLLRPSVDFNAGNPVRESQDSISVHARSILDDLGANTDTLQTMALFNQHVGYYKLLKDSIDQHQLVTASRLHQRGANLQSWSVLLASQINDTENIAMSEQQLFNTSGRIRLWLDQSGKLFKLDVNPNYPNITFVQGDSLVELAHDVVDDIFGYELSNYRLSWVDFEDTLMTAVRSETNGSFNLSQVARQNQSTFKWRKKGSVFSGPEHLDLTVTPHIKEQPSSFGTSFSYGISINSFEAYDTHRNVASISAQSRGSLNISMLFVCLGLLAGLVFFLGLRQIFKGQVDWSRVITVMIVIGVGNFLWRFMFMNNIYLPFFGDTVDIVIIFNQILYAAILGLFTAMAYVGWETLAREKGQDELSLLDAFWQRRYFFRETGDSIIKGYAMGGMMLGLLVIVLYAFGIVFYQSDGDLGFADLVNQPIWLSMNIGLILNAALVTIGVVGVVISFLREKITRSLIVNILSVMFLGLFLSSLSANFNTTGSYIERFVTFSVLSIPLVAVFRSSGIIAVFVGWWMFSLVITSTPYWGSPDPNLAVVSWIQVTLLLVPILYAAVAYRYGSSLAEIEGYVPEYEERLANHLRVEKEIEIARESQFKLMPLKAPVVEGLDLYGFFLPSYEVGGDYFDYVISKNGQADPESVALTIVDVSGKAMKAAMHAVFTSGLLLSRLHKDQPDEILKEISPTIYQKTDTRTFITCLIARYDLSSRKLRLANAGHCLPVLKRGDKVEYVKTPDPKYPLGVRPEVVYQPLDVQLQQGDFILFYSDGLPESVDENGERFGYEEVINLVRDMDTVTKTAQEIAADIRKLIQRFSDYQLADDTTIICMKVK